MVDNVAKFLGELGFGETVDNDFASEAEDVCTSAKASKPTRKQRKQEAQDAIVPAPLSHHMVCLRNQAEFLYLQWAGGSDAIVSDKLNLAARKDLAILCALLNECAPALCRADLTSWLEANLREVRTPAAPEQETDSEWTVPAPLPKAPVQALRNRRMEINLRAFGLGRMAAATPISHKSIALREMADILVREWVLGRDGRVGDWLNAASRATLGILCSLLNERVPPLKRIYFTNWLEAVLAEPIPAEAEHAICK